MVATNRRRTAFRSRRIRIAMQADFSFGHDRSGEIDHYRLTACDRHAPGERIGRESALASAPRRDSGHGQCVDEMKRCASQFRREFHPVAEASDVRAVAQCDQCDALCFCFCAGEAGGVLCADLAKAQSTFKHRKALTFANELRLPAAYDLALLNLLNVLLHAQHAVRRVTDEVRLDEIMRDRFCLTLTGTCGDENFRHEV